MRKSEKYEVVIRWNEEDQCYIAHAPELGNCAVRGKNRQEALLLAQDAVERHLQALESNGLPIPIPLSEKKFSGKILIRVDPRIHRDVAMKASIEGVSINQFIERKLKTTQTQS